MNVSFFSAGPVMDSDEAVVAALLLNHNLEEAAVPAWLGDSDAGDISESTLAGSESFYLSSDGEVSEESDDSYTFTLQPGRRGPFTLGRFARGFSDDDDEARGDTSMEEDSVSEGAPGSVEEAASVGCPMLPFISPVVWQGRADPAPAVLHGPQGKIAAACVCFAGC